MAEAIARRVAAERGLSDVEIGSAGTSAWDGSGASEGALLVGLERTLDLSSHRSRLLTPQMIQGADLVLAMSAAHAEQAEQLGGAGKTHLLTSYASSGGAARNVADPFGGDLEGYRTTFDELEREIRLVFDRIVAERGTGAS
jgi:protein-tyrosine-phosphatase